jgi:CDP-diacylglycerol--serine O-phosphatidyltransferase
MMRHIPNFITSLNLAAGFAAIIFASGGDILTASWLILAAMIFDFLDGFSARLLKAYSALGKELDSLADVVSFGVAPGLIIYHLMKESLPIENTLEINSGVIYISSLMVISAIMPVCAALRLARFNIDTSQSTSFKGLPTPANAIAVISLVFAVNYSASGIFGTFAGSCILLALYALILSGLMISRIPLMSLKLVSLKLKGNEERYILAVLVLSSFAVIGTGAATLIIPLYIIVSLASQAF